MGLSYILRHKRIQMFKSFSSFIIILLIIACGEISSDIQGSKLYSTNGIIVRNESRSTTFTSLFVYESGKAYKGHDQMFGGSLQPKSRISNVVAYGGQSFCKAAIEASGYEIDQWGNRTQVQFTGVQNLCDHPNISLSSTGIQTSR